MKKKISEKYKKTRVPSPFDNTSHKTERSGVGVLQHWMRQIIEDGGIDLGLPDVETAGTDRKMPDIVIYESRRSQNVLCVIEAKPPYYDVFDEIELKEPARKKATQRKAKYFCLTNFKSLIWYNTEKVNRLMLEEEQIVDKYVLSEIENLDDIESTRFSETIKRELACFIHDLYSVNKGEKAEKKIAIDDFLVYRLHEKIRILSKYYKTIIEEESHKNPIFAKDITKWFKEQMWSFSWNPEDFEKAARQTAYLLVNKILFYNLLQAKRINELNPLEIPDGLTKGDVLQSFLQAYFNNVLKIDYETIFSTDFIDFIAFPNNVEVVKEIKELIKILRRYDFSSIGYDIIGRIFENLIPEKERHSLGQYFTSSDVVDLMLSFCIQHESDKILDPSCGAGTFLVRSYQHKKLMNLRAKHEDILDTLWGIDIAKFPAHLSTINLAINDLGVEKNYPCIINQDFFSVMTQPEGGFVLPERWRKLRARTLGLDERDVTFPRFFDIIVGNPPYTRQEEIQKIGVDKEQLISNAVKNVSNNNIAEISGQAGLHVYFFIHGTKFLKEDGYFSFIVSNSWLDAGYGVGLQEFFLNNYKIVAIIESKVEKWFPDADINTCIIVLQKCQSIKERNGNVVRFVSLRKKLEEFIPPAEDMWEKQIERIKRINLLKRIILRHDEYYENHEIQITTRIQKQLLIDGTFESKKYLGSRWSIYLRSPQIYFKLIKNRSGLFFPLSNKFKIIYGIKTGCNDYFFLEDSIIKKWKIEEEYLKNTVHLYRNIKSPILNNKYDSKLLFVNKTKKELKNSNVANYINWGEKAGINARKSVANRTLWYNLGDIHESYILFPQFFNNRFGVIFSEAKVVAGNVFWQVICEKKEAKLLASYMNSTLFYLFIEIYGRSSMGQGVLTLYGPDINNLPIINIDKLMIYKNELEEVFFKELGQRKAETIFTELGTDDSNNFELENVLSDRRKLDKIIMEKILRLNSSEQIDIYKALIDMVSSRFLRAISKKKKNKNKSGVDISILKDTIIRKLNES
ncbi:MAG: class I SAM-dependent DNA methyltransferase [Vulcanibacillus sp.]